MAVYLSISVLQFALPDLLIIINIIFLYIYFMSKILIEFVINVRQRICIWEFVDQSITFLFAIEMVKPSKDRNVKRRS